MELKDIKELAIAIRNDNYDSGVHYLLGYLWSSFTTEQQEEIAKSFREQLAEKVGE